MSVLLRRAVGPRGTLLLVGIFLALSPLAWAKASDCPADLSASPSASAASSAPKSWRWPAGGDRRWWPGGEAASPASGSLLLQVSGKASLARGAVGDLIEENLAEKQTDSSQSQHAAPVAAAPAVTPQAEAPASGAAASSSPSASPDSERPSFNVLPPAHAAKAEEPQPDSLIQLLDSWVRLQPSLSQVRVLEKRESQDFVMAVIAVISIVVVLVGCVCCCIFSRRPDPRQQMFYDDKRQPPLLVPRSGGACDDCVPAQRYADPRYPGPGYADPAYVDPAYVDSRYGTYQDYSQQPLRQGMPPRTRAPDACC